MRCCGAGIPSSLPFSLSDLSLEGHHLPSSLLSLPRRYMVTRQQHPPIRIVRARSKQAAAGIPRHQLRSARSLQASECFHEPLLLGFHFLLPRLGKATFPLPRARTSSVDLPHSLFSWSGCITDSFNLFASLHSSSLLRGGASRMPSNAARTVAAASTAHATLSRSILVSCFGFLFTRI